MCPDRETSNIQGTQYVEIYKEMGDLKSSVVDIKAQVKHGMTGMRREMDIIRESQKILGEKHDRTLEVVNKLEKKQSQTHVIVGSMDGTLKKMAARDEEKQRLDQEISARTAGWKKLIKWAIGAVIAALAAAGVITIKDAEYESQVDEPASSVE